MTAGEWFISICTVIVLAFGAYIAVMFWLMWGQVKVLSDRVNELEAGKMDRISNRAGELIETAKPWDWSADVEDRRVN